MTTPTLAKGDDVNQYADCPAYERALRGSLAALLGATLLIAGSTLVVMVTLGVA